MSALMERDLWCLTRTRGRPPSRSRSWSTGPRSLRNSDADDGNQTRPYEIVAPLTAPWQQKDEVLGVLVGQQGAGPKPAKAVALSKTLHNNFFPLGFTSRGICPSAAPPADSLYQCGNENVNIGHTQTIVLQYHP
jgi:hypothetical protein